LLGRVHDPSEQHRFRHPPQCVAASQLFGHTKQIMQATEAPYDDAASGHEAEHASTQTLSSSSGVAGSSSGQPGWVAPSPNMQTTHSFEPGLFANVSNSSAHSPATAQSLQLRHAEESIAAASPVSHAAGPVPLDPPAPEEAEVVDAAEVANVVDALEVVDAFAPPAPSPSLVPPVPRKSTPTQPTSVTASDR
jgi:hypothetical protein